jgi:transposase
MSQVLRESAISMLTAGMSTRAVASELNVNFYTISCLQRRFREFGSMSNRPHNRSVGKRFADANVVNRVPMVAVGLPYGQAGIS